MDVCVPLRSSSLSLRQFRWLGMRASSSASSRTIRAAVAESSSFAQTVGRARNGDGGGTGAGTGTSRSRDGEREKETGTR